MDESILAIAVQAYGISPLRLKPTAGGHFTHVYGFSKTGRDYVLRITPPNEELDVQASLSILEWINYLAAHGAPVSSPLRSQHGRLVELIDREDQCYMVVAFEKAQGILAEELPAGQWSPPLYQELGRTVGKLHALAMTYRPAEALKRPHWDQSGNCFNPQRPVDETQAFIQEKRAAVLDILNTLPKDPESYGLIHADLHFANFFVDAARPAFTIFDFDDCAYGWYPMDIAMLLFDILVWHPSPDKQELARGFLANFLKGYLEEKGLRPFWLSRLPHFLKLLEIGIYIQLYPKYDPLDCDEWVGKFMAGRKERLQNDFPYIDLDFEPVRNLV